MTDAALDVQLTQYGDVTCEPISRVQQYVAKMLTESCNRIPHVTHNDDIDIDVLEGFRQQYNARHPDAKLTVLPFLIKAMVQVLDRFPRFNAQLDVEGKNLLLKHYVNVGVAVDTPNGLLVPVIKHCERKSLLEIADELNKVSSLAREKGLPYDAMQGGGITISSLGSIGGTSFTPIINAPEVAILGVTKTALKPVLIAGELQWKHYLPLSLSYDHRVINGAAAAQFCVEMGKVLGAPQQLI